MYLSLDIPEILARYNGEIIQEKYVLVCQDFKNYIHLVALKCPVFKEVWVGFVFR